jgi:hypothetical protein
LLTNTKFLSLTCKLSTMKKIFSLFAFLIVFNFVNAQSIQVSLTVLTQPCTNNGEVQINATAGSGNYTYTFNYWPDVVGGNPTLTNNILSGLPPGNLHVSVYDGTGASGWADIVLLGPIQSTITSTPAICPALGEIQITNIGNGPFIDELYFNNMLIATGAPFTNLSPGQYFLKTTDVNGCYVNSDTIFIENISGVDVSLTTSNLTCQGGTLTAAVVGGLTPYTYSWSTGTSITNVMNGPIGQHQVTVTDAQGCSQMESQSITSPIYLYPNAVVAPTACPLSTGSISLFPSGGTPPYTCNWGNGSSGLSINNLTAGAYPATIIDAAGCFTALTLYVNTSNSINVTGSTTSSSCLIPTGGATLSISGGTSPYTVQWYTNPQQNGPTLSNVLPGFYSFAVTDANGCIKTGGYTIDASTPISIYRQVTDATCGQNNGSIELYINTNNNYTFLWSNGSTSSSLYNLSGGNYSCVVTSADGCSKSFGEYVNTLSPFNVSSNISNASCIYTADGQISLNITGGTSPFNVTWSNGATGANISSLMKGDYYATISDANGCNFSYHYTVGYLSTSPCACTLTGKVYFDANNNCVYDSLETPLSNVNVKLISGTNTSYSITNSSGVYSFYVPAGTYSIEQLSYQHYAAGACSTNPITVNANGGTNCIIINNFADTAPSIQDLSTNYMNILPAVVGYSYKQRILVKNQGTTTANNAKVNLRGNNNASIVSSTFAGTNVLGTDNWNFTGLPSLDPTETFSFDLNYAISSTVPTNTLLNFTDTVQKNSQPWVQDATPWNNIKNLQTNTVASLDPNYKEVTPKGTGVNGDINFSDSILTYTVHFENTGTYFAYNIEIVDSISINLDLNSLEMIYGSHPYEASIDENRVLHIKFNNIMLGYNTGWNTGFAVYSIKLLNNLPIGTQIKNTAYIYFDFNEAVITNTTVNTLSVNVGIEELNNGEYNLFPNPASNMLTITNNVNTLKGTINVYDMIGKLWLSKTISQPVNKVEIYNLDELTNGLYFVNITNDLGEVKTIKFVKSE